jgi:hypothetical protein
VVLTINGKAELVVQDAASYQRLFQLARKEACPPPWGGSRS